MRSDAQRRLSCPSLRYSVLRLMPRRRAAADRLPALSDRANVIAYLNTLK